MRVAFDGKKAATNRAGLGNYSRFVIKCMAERFPETVFDVYVPRDTPLLSALRTLPNVNICLPTHPLLRHFPLLWERFGIAYEIRKRGADIFHGLANVISPGVAGVEGLKTVVTIHDLIFLCFPHTYSWTDRHLFNMKFRKSSGIADRIVAVSKCTAADIVKYYRIDPGKISLAYQGCDSSFRSKCSPAFKDLVRQRFSLPQHYVLSVGTIEERKNTALIVKAMKDIPSLDIVLVGKRTPYTSFVERTAAEFGVADRLHILSGVGFKELPAVYQMADVFVYPSRYEGFGIPVLEALCSGVPSIAATGSCLEEAGGDAAMYVDPDDAGALSECISRILSDDALAAGMVEKGYAHAKDFTDDELADRLMSIYRELAD